MKLTSLRLHGFKSFADRTEIEFHEGITAIVGPNGCGKSNISDAIRWVLGEQRPSAIRGAKMEEAIFQGTVNRRRVNRGSVTMTVSNEDGALPVPFEEVEIGRTVYRDGGSDYSLNRSSCRLKDVQELCRDTGLGANAYAVIENKMIDLILSDRAEERRGLFEEAAGIGKYKDRRKAAVRRLERAEVDLQRLEDVIGEVRTKVRSLARQKGKAQRYEELRDRRLDVEVAVVRHDLEEMAARLDEVEKILEGDSRTQQGVVAELRTAEARCEELRKRQVDAEKDRTRAAGRLEEVKEKLVTWERDMAVARERAQHAEHRLDRISEERREAQERLESLSAKTGELSEARADLEARFAEVRGEADDARERAEAVRERLREARESLEALESREREIARRGAQLEGDAEAADDQAAELERRAERLRRELEDTAETLSDLESQGDLFSDRLGALEQELEKARAAVEEAETAVESGRRELESAREEELRAENEAAVLEARLEALEALERDREGVEPAVAAAVEADLPGVMGRLSESLSGDPELIRVVEAFLGPLAAGLVVRDRETAEAVGSWFQNHWGGGGGLVLLPLDRVPEVAESGDLLSALEVSGPGAPWVRALLGRVSLVSEGELLQPDAGSGPRLTRGGAAVDVVGVVRFGNPLGATGALERQERLRQLRPRCEDARRQASEARAHREEKARRLAELEETYERAREALREARDAHHGVRADEAAHGDRRTRVDRHREDLARQLEGTRAARERSLERAEEAREERACLLEEEEMLRGRRAEAREALEAVQEEWEAARAEESRLSVEVARLEADLSRAREREDEVERSLEGTRQRIEALDGEEEQQRAQLEGARETMEKGEEAMERLFGERDESKEELQARTRALEEVAEALSEAESRARAARSAEREASERRHQLELERQDLDGRIGRIQERLEGEWGRPLETLLEQADPLEGDPDELREELREIVVAVERLGPVNMLAVEEHAEESARLEFLEEQRDDLVEARDDLRRAIREINETAVDLFNETFAKIRENFRDTFLRLFQGGEADLWLEDPEDPLESPVEIHASPRGKKTQRIDLLSGGERALTALSLLFGIYLVKPSPFCVLDEVDAPLDENNIGRFIHLLQEFKDETQFVVITHNPRTIESADWIYGVTMEEPGVSSVVGVRLEDGLQASGSAA